MDTVLNFRNRRYEYKRKQKKAGDEAQKADQLLQNQTLSPQERLALTDNYNTQKALVVLNESL